MSLSINDSGTPVHQESVPALDELDTGSISAPAPISNGVSTQTDITMAFFDQLDQERKSLRNENLKIKEEVARLSLDEETFRASEDKVKLLTGLPTYQCLLIILTLISVHLPKFEVLTPFQQLLMTLMRL